MTEKAKPKCIVAVRIRGVVRGSREARDTLAMLHLTRNNYATILDDRPSFIGMLREAHNFVTWGEISKETLAMLVAKRARSRGDRKLTEEYLEKAGFKSAEDLAEAIFDSRIEYRRLRDIVPFFRLHPPSKGFKGSVKKSIAAGGESGYRGAKIDELVVRMI